MGVLGIIVLAPLAYGTLTGGSSNGATIQAETYQALFLTNNQIYFGHLETGKEFFILRDVYYVQVADNGAQGRIVKLGDVETHQPQNTMIINSDHVLFWENLKPESPVIKTILNLQLQGH